MASKTQSQKSNEISIQTLKRGNVLLRIIGTTPLYQNRMANKVIEGLLVGSHKKTNAEKRNIKHHPIEEFQSSAETVMGGPTALGLKVVAIKAAMCSAALETNGIYKTTAEKLLSIQGDHAVLYGKPYLRMDIVRCADKNRTPDIRSRCYLPKWGAEVDIEYTAPALSAASTVNLLCNAGLLIGLGDNRQEKGKGSYGLFRVIGAGTQDPEWDELVKSHGREVQEAALAYPEPADQSTADLLNFYHGEVRRRAA